MCAKIVFADDDPLMERLYQPYLERAGFQWVGARNGREAVEAATREQPQLAIVDVYMPEMDGLSAMLELKQRKETRAIPVIVITADPEHYLYRERFREAGAAGFMVKPFSPSQLMQVIRGLISDRPVPVAAAA